MTTEEDELLAGLLHLVQSGVIVIVAVAYFPQTERHRLGVHGPSPDPDGLVEAFHQACSDYPVVGSCMLDLTLMNDARVCSSAKQHRERSWHKMWDTTSNEVVSRCDACAAMRAEGK